MTVITYLLYGDNRTYQLELAFSVLSALRFLRHQADCTISVISDRDDIGFDLPIDRIGVSAQEIADWTQGGVYPHRAKILALMKAIDHYQAPTVLIDTDTYFLKNPLELFQFISPDASLMHNFECTIGDHRLWQPMFNSLEPEKLEQIYQTTSNDIRISPQLPMFNSGVVGIDISHRSLLDQALALLDRLYEVFPVFNTEQFALGVVLSQATNLSICPHLVKHYWGYERRFIHTQLADYLQNYSINYLDTFLETLPNLEIGYPPKPWRAKLAARCLSLLHGWNQDYRFAYLAYRSALYYAKTNVPYANIWAQIARRSIDLCLEKHPELQATDRSFQAFQTQTQHYFHEFSPTNISRLRWMQPNTQQQWQTLWQLRS
jgi:hypothetical protein